MSAAPGCIVTRTPWVTIKECWFGPDEGQLAADVLVMRQWPQMDWTGQAADKHTLLIALDAPPEQIQAGFKKDTQYEVRRAQAKDGLGLVMQNEPDMGRLKDFADFFDEFALQKGLSLVDRTYLQAAARAGSLVLTSACRGDQALVFHSYIRAGKRVRLLHSASLYRADGAEPGFRSLVGRANRWLHWQDMLAFAAQGCSTYDFGGWYAGQSDEEKLRINAFKQEFGGQPVREFDGQQALTLKGRVYLWLRAQRRKGA